MRQRSGSLVCAKCGKLVSIDERQCPYCGSWRPGLFGFAPALRRVFGGQIDLTTGIIGSCALLYVAALALQPSAITSPRGGILGFLAPGGKALYELGMTGGVAWQQGWWWTLFTAIYLHGGLLHIAFNMLWVRELMPPVVDVFGSARTFVLFNVAGVVGFLVSNVVTGVPSIGASGAIFGLLGALVVYGRRRGSDVLTAQAWRWAVLLFVFGLIVPSVNNWAHAGGFAGGAACAALVGTAEQRESAAVQLLALACAGVVLAGVALSYSGVLQLQG
jgi:membrane associated rhomboid family serine protease